MHGEQNEIIIDGDRYISAKRAAQLTHYTTDYVGQLCRGNKVIATRIGRNWYVNEGSLIDHKQANVQNGPPTSTNTEVQTVKEVVTPQKQHPRSLFKHSFIVYRQDDSPLFPALSEQSPSPEENKLPGDAESKEENPALPKDTTETKIKNPLSFLVLLKNTALTAAFLLVCALTLSLGNIYYRSDNNVFLSTDMEDTQVAQVIDTDIVRPLEYAARELHMLVDDTVYTFLYQ